MIFASSVGSHSSRYIATCASVTRRRIGHTRPYRSSPTKIATVTMRNAMIAGALKRNDSSPDADRRSASTVPATTTTAPRMASLRPQRFRTRRMTSTSSVRWSMSLAPTARLQEFFLPREMIRNRRLDGQKADAGQQQIPPQALSMLRLFPRHLLRLIGLDGDRRRMAGDRRDQLARVDRAQIRFRGVE